MKTKYLNTGVNKKNYKSFLLLSFFLFVCTIGISQNCQAKLEVERNGKFQSVTENGAIFKLELTNTGKSAETFKINTSFLKSSCNSSFQKKVNENVELNITILNKSMSAMKSNDIRLNAGAKTSLMIKVNAPKGTKFNSWSCVDVNAVATSCNKSVANVVLSAYVMDPSEN